MFDLFPHPACRPRAVNRVAFEIMRDDVGLRLELCLWGALHEVRLPAETRPARRDELWRTTCFEVFLRPPGPSYFEINISPSGEWATYQFDDYRSNMRLAEIRMEGEPFYLSDGEIFEMTVNLNSHDAPELRGAEPWAMGLSAIIEEESGLKSYWALAHASGPPDFHNSACFVATLPPMARE